MSRTIEVHDQVREPFTGEPTGPADPAYEQTRRAHNGLIHIPARSAPGHSRPNTAPAYCLGRPAHVWISVMSRRRRRPAPEHPADAVAVAWNGHYPAVAASAGQ